MSGNCGRCEDEIHNNSAGVYLRRYRAWGICGLRVGGVMSYYDIHKAVFIELYRNYLAGIQVTHGPCDPKEVARELAREAGVVAESYREALKELRQHVQEKGDE